MAKIPGKKCIPGLFCIDNMTLFIFLILLLFILFLVYRLSDLGSKTPIYPASNCNPIIQDIYTSVNPPIMVYGNRNPTIDIRGDPLTNPYVPPEQNPITIKPIATQPYNIQYAQVGILTRKDSHSNTGSSSSTKNTEILPLMGRRQITTRDKWQYYTVSGGGNGNFQTKLPIRVNGKSGSGEYGCDEIYTNDTVYVEGYKEIFQATIYENNTFQYIP